MGKKKIPTYNELVDKIMAFCPNAEFEEDGDGQIIVRTGYAMVGDEDDPLEPLSEIDEDSDLEDEDEDEDEDEADEDYEDD